MIIVCQKLLKNTKINGITLYPFILIKNIEDQHNNILLNHEKIHLRQQLELLIIFFYLWYITEYFIHLFRYQNRQRAYMAISFEREAYANERDFEYLKSRSAWSFFRYFK